MKKTNRYKYCQICGKEVGSGKELRRKLEKLIDKDCVVGMMTVHTMHIIIEKIEKRKKEAGGSKHE